MPKKSSMKKVYTCCVLWVKHDRRIGYVHLGSRTSGQEITKIVLVFAPYEQKPDKSIFDGALRMTLAQARLMKAFVQKACPDGEVQIRKRFQWV